MRKAALTALLMVTFAGAAEAQRYSVSDLQATWFADGFNGMCTVVLNGSNTVQIIRKPAGGCLVTVVSSTRDDLLQRIHTFTGEVKLRYDFVHTTSEQRLCNNVSFPIRRRGQSNYLMWMPGDKSRMDGYADNRIVEEWGTCRVVLTTTTAARFSRVSKAPY